MPPHPIPASFAADDSVVATGPSGQLAHRATFAQMERVADRLDEVCPGVWCMVGNGLSNQTFVAAPDGLITCGLRMRCGVAIPTDGTDAVRRLLGCFDVAAFQTTDDGSRP